MKKTQKSDIKEINVSFVALTFVALFLWISSLTTLWLHSLFLSTVWHDFQQQKEGHSIWVQHKWISLSHKKPNALEWYPWNNSPWSNWTEIARWDQQINTMILIDAVLFFFFFFSPNPLFVSWILDIWKRCSNAMWEYYSQI